MSIRNDLNRFLNANRGHRIDTVQLWRNDSEEDKPLYWLEIRDACYAVNREDQNDWYVVGQRHITASEMAKALRWVKRHNGIIAGFYIQVTDEYHSLYEDFGSLKLDTKAIEMGANNE